ncbi:hypothetical protein F7725_018923 [Dissostichus mawsoni]|uniref:Uncharacterized protein n=1 Tax=Dissostichus mawsoni TaxID=36200 RepID=A0A7J5XSW5_DISMA|nr:hypothetical protein F7725_018923 [Dissostichus mawsoni]
MAAVSISVYKNTKADRSATLKDTTLCTEKHQPRRFKPYLLPGDGHVVLDVSEHVKATLSTSMCRAMAAPADGPRPAKMFTTPSGKPTWKQKHAGYVESCERSLLSDLHHHGVPSGQGRAQLPGLHQQREVPLQGEERGSGQLKQRNPGSVEPERAVMVGEVSR